jgi:hypothetical protein
VHGPGVLSSAASRFYRKHENLKTHPSVVCFGSSRENLKRFFTGSLESGQYLLYSYIST